MILASKYMGLMGDSRASVRDSALILASVAAPSDGELLLFQKRNVSGNMYRLMKLRENFL